MKPLDADSATCVEWLKRPEGESGIEFMKRALELSTSSAKGLAFSASGSLGIRHTSGSQPRQWKVRGLPYAVSDSHLRCFRTDNGWTAITSTEQIRGRQKPMWIIKAKAPTDSQLFALRTECGGTHIDIEIERWASKSKRLSVKPLAAKSVSYKDTRAPDNSQSSSFNVSDISERNSGAKATAGDADGEQPTKFAKLEVSKKYDINKLGLTLHNVSGDGACFYHALILLFDNIRGAFPKLPANAAQARATVVSVLRQRSGPFTSVWDQLVSQGNSCPNWEAYLNEQEAHATAAGELEMIAAPFKWGLQIVVLRPNEHSLLFGEGRIKLWLILADNHFTPCVQVDSPTNSTARSTYRNSIDQHFSFTFQNLVSTAKVGTKFWAGAISVCDSGASAIASNSCSGSDGTSIRRVSSEVELA